MLNFDNNEINLLIHSIQKSKQPKWVHGPAVEVGDDGNLQQFQKKSSLFGSNEPQVSIMICNSTPQISQKIVCPRNLGWVMDHYVGPRRAGRVPSRDSPVRHHFPAQRIVELRHGGAIQQDLPGTAPVPEESSKRCLKLLSPRVKQHLGLSWNGG